MAGRNLDSVIEAILFSSDDALSAERIAGALERKDATPSAVRESIARLNEAYRQNGRAFEVAEVAGGFKMTTLPEYNTYVRRVLRSRSRDRLSQAALETLAIVAYRQPVTRAEIENIRGVEAGPVLRALVDRGLVRIVGRAQALGHPLLYGTTRQFLEAFGLKSLDALPRADELMAREEQGGAPDEAEPDEAAPGDEEGFEEAEPAESEGELEQPADDAGDETAESSAALADAMAHLTEDDGAGLPGDNAEAEPADQAAPGDDETGDDAESIIRLANHQPDAPTTPDAPPEEDLQKTGDDDGDPDSSSR